MCTTKRNHKKLGVSIKGNLISCHFGFEIAEFEIAFTVKKDITFLGKVSLEDLRPWQNFEIN